MSVERAREIAKAVQNFGERNSPKIMEPPPKVGEGLVPFGLIGSGLPSLGLDWFDFGWFVFIEFGLVWYGLA